MTEISSPALADLPATPVSQRELLGLALGCAALRSASFGQAEFALLAAGARATEVRMLARELLTDFAIRGWIELRRRHADQGEDAIARRDWEAELAAERNWGEPAVGCALYALTDPATRSSRAAPSADRRSADLDQVATRASSAIEVTPGADLRQAVLAQGQHALLAGDRGDLASGAPPTVRSLIRSLISITEKIPIRPL